MLSESLHQKRFGPGPLSTKIAVLQQEVEALDIKIKTFINQESSLLGNPIYYLQNQCLELYYTLVYFVDSLNNDAQNESKLHIVITRLSNWFELLIAQFNALIKSE